MSSLQESAVIDRSSLWRRLPLYLAFAATGFSCALPGALMPWLLARWTLKDSQAGLLLGLFFVGGTCGALLSRGSLRWSIFRGALCTSLGAALLPFASGRTANGVILLFGLGLGIAMTSISLLQSRRCTDTRPAEMTRLNLLWAIGACTGPWIILHEGARNAANATNVLLILAGIFAVFGAWIAAFERDEPTLDPSPASSPRLVSFAAPLSLLLLVVCATGVESSSAGWLATYSQRSGDSLGVTIGAPTCLWIGLLTSRLVHSSDAIGRATRQFLLTWNLLAMAAALAALVLFRNGSVLMAAAFVTGFAAGPIYPLLLALVFEHDSGNTVYVLGGIGSALLPYLTGAVSSRTGSLRMGILMPCIAAIVMAATGWSFTRTNQVDTR
jgi:MFS transporter, FHS family, glucose/mannose:H+ symporter